jgi:hypothetical protein
MDGRQLFDLFYDGRATLWEIGRMDLEAITRQIGELRQAGPDDLALSDKEIARRILEYENECSERLHQVYQYILSWPLPENDSGDA